MNALFKTIRKDSLVFWSFWITIVTIILMIIAISVSYTNLPPFIPLYNHMPWGYGRLGRTYELFLLPVSILAVCIVNTVVSIRLAEKSPLLVRFLFLTMVSVAIFSCIFVGKLIFVTL